MSSSVDLVCYDRFSPINPKTQSRVLTEMTATLKVFWWRPSDIIYGIELLVIELDLLYIAK